MMEEFILNLNWKYVAFYLLLWLLAELVIYKGSYIYGRIMTARKENRRIKTSANDLQTLQGMQSFCFIVWMIMAIVLFKPLAQIAEIKTLGGRGLVFLETLVFSGVLIAAVGVPLMIKRIKKAIRDTSTGSAV